MSYIAVDTFGDEYIYPFKPERKTVKNKLGEEWGYWQSNILKSLKVQQERYTMPT